MDRKAFDMTLFLLGFEYHPAPDIKYVGHINDEYYKRGTERIWHENPMLVNPRAKVFYSSNREDPNVFEQYFHTFDDLIKYLSTPGYNGEKRM